MLSSKNLNCLSAYKKCQKGAYWNYLVYHIVCLLYPLNKVPVFRQESLTRSFDYLCKILIVHAFMACQLLQLCVQ
jgi:hypothetical protein